MREAQVLSVSITGSGSGMSDTPRTDAEVKLRERLPAMNHGVSAEFARQLERELHITKQREAVLLSSSSSTAKVIVGVGLIQRLRGHAEIPMKVHDHCAIVPRSVLREAANWIDQSEREHLYLEHEIDRLKYQLAMTPDDGYVPPKK